MFPSPHHGFLGGKFGYTSMPETLAARLHEKLGGRDRQRRGNRDYAVRETGL